MNLPVEIILIIVLKLDAKNLGNLRLVNRALATTCAQCIVQNGISIMNTAWWLKDLEYFLTRKHVVGFTRKITIYTGQWSLFTRQDWRAHDKEVYAIRRALLSLGELDSIVISQVDNHISQIPKYQNLRRNIRTTSKIEIEVAPTVQSFLLAYGNGQYAGNNITTLIINGRFDPGHVYLGSALHCFRNIRKLHITSFQVRHNEDVIQKFLQSFPDLVELLLSFRGWADCLGWGYDFLFFNSSFWPCLRDFQIKDVWVTEDDLFELTKRHRSTLRFVALGNIFLTKGSWQSYFTRVRELQSPISVLPKGDLYSQETSELIRFSTEASYILMDFMQDINLGWPFHEFSLTNFNPLHVATSWDAI